MNNWFDDMKEFFELGLEVKEIFTNENNLDIVSWALRM